MTLTEEERREAYKYALKIGFIISKPHLDWSKEKKIKKIYQAIGQGFRVEDCRNNVYYEDDFNVINVLDRKFSDRKKEQIIDLAKWLTEDDTNEDS